MTQNLPANISGISRSRVVKVPQVLICYLASLFLPRRDTHSAPKNSSFSPSKPVTPDVTDWQGDGCCQKQPMKPSQWL